MDLEDLEGGIECLQCRTLSPRLSTLNFFFSIFSINYSPLIARIIKRGSGKGRRGVPGVSAPACAPGCVRKQVRPFCRKEQRGGSRK